MLWAKSKRRVTGAYCFSFPLHPRSSIRTKANAAHRLQKAQPLPAGEQLLDLPTAQGLCLSPFTLALSDTLGLLVTVQTTAQLKNTTH